HDFGWYDRINVATQLADLFAWFHGKSIAIGSVTTSCVMVDERLNTKVFDFGFVSNHVNEDSEIHVLADFGNDACKGTMKADIYVFGPLLLELIAKYKYKNGPSGLMVWIQDKLLSKKGLVHECFEEVEDGTANEITLVILRCVDWDPKKMAKDEGYFRCFESDGYERGETEKR
ncbi:hypothetical protein HAX54_051475, partial [Datura stramonium]|nr:hypothetical protein [Datura stramonium]